VVIFELRKAIRTLAHLRMPRSTGTIVAVLRRPVLRWSLALVFGIKRFGDKR